MTALRPYKILKREARYLSETWLHIRLETEVQMPAGNKTRARVHVEIKSVNRSKQTKAYYNATSAFESLNDAKLEYFQPSPNFCRILGEYSWTVLYRNLGRTFIGFLKGTEAPIIKLS